MSTAAAGPSDGPRSRASCLYTGTITHRRQQPATGFRHRIAMAYIDLDELPHLAGGRLVRRRTGLVRFRRRDYHGSPEVPLKDAVRATVLQQTGSCPEGPVRVLTNLRFLGHCFNPVSFYYCFDHDGRLQALLAEVTNTPWGERHAYVIPRGSGEFRKAMHVSPFMGMDHTYSAVAPSPGRELRVSIENSREGRPVFAATLALTREELTNGSLRALLRRYPLGSVRVLALIYMQALRLRLAGASVFSHPDRRTR